MVKTKILLMLSTIFAIANMGLSTTSLAATECNMAQLIQHTVEKVVTPTGEQMRQMQQAWLAVLHDPENTQPWQDLGYRQITCHSYRLLVPDSSTNGWGIIGVYPQAPAHKILQIPHQFHDRHSGEIGAALFLAGKFRVVQWNNVVRYNDHQPANLSDMTKTERSSFSALALALVEFSATDVASPKHQAPPRLYQLHGFAGAKRNEPRAQHADIIVSSGGYAPNIHSLTLNKCWSDSYATLLFPDDTRELGATKNASNAVLLSHQLPDRFIHIELSDKLRNQLLDPAAFIRWGSCL